MSDYTREQQIADIKAAFGQVAHVVFIDDQEIILVAFQGAVFCCDIGSDDDEMVFYLLHNSGQTITVPMTVS
jgi:hypothetical protein